MKHFKNITHKDLKQFCKLLYRIEDKYIKDIIIKKQSKNVDGKSNLFLLMTQVQQFLVATSFL